MRTSRFLIHPEYERADPHQKYRYDIAIAKFGHDVNLPSHYGPPAEMSVSEPKTGDPITFYTWDRHAKRGDINPERLYKMTAFMSGYMRKFPLMQWPNYKEVRNAATTNAYQFAASP